MATASQRRRIRDYTGYTRSFTWEGRAMDRGLRGRTRVTVLIDRALARSLVLLAANRLYRRLGFVRMADYAREAIGLSHRSVQEMVRTEQLLSGLPLIAATWESGVLHSEQVRLLSRVATVDTERLWLQAARGLSVRKLAEFIGLWKDSQRNGGPGPGADTIETLPEGSSEEEAARVALISLFAIREGRHESPSPVPNDHGGASEPLTSRHTDPGDYGDAGEPLTSGPADPGDHGGASEPLTPQSVDPNTPGGAGVPLTPPPRTLDDEEEEEATERISFAAPVPVAVRWRQTLRLCAALSGADLPDWALVENICAEYLSGCPLEEPDGEETGPTSPKSHARCPSFAWGFRSEHDFEGHPGDVEREANARLPWAPAGLIRYLNAEAPEDAWQLHERLVRLSEMRTRWDANMSRALLEFTLAGGAWQAGFRDTARYASEVLGLRERKARFLLFLQRRFFEAPLIREEFHQGRLTWLQCLLVMRIRHCPSSERAWITYAGQVTVRRLKEAVEEALARPWLACPTLPPLPPGAVACPTLPPLPPGAVACPTLPPLPPGAVACPTLSPPLPGTRASHTLPPPHQSGEDALAGPLQTSARLGFPGGLLRGEASEFGTPALGAATPHASEDPTGQPEAFEVQPDVFSKDTGTFPNQPEPYSVRSGAFPYEPSRGASSLPPSSDRQMSARGCAGEVQPLMSRISFTAPPTVADLWRETLLRVSRGERRRLEEWEAVDRLLEAFISTWDNEQTREMRRDHAIMDRDGWRCTVPVCSSRANLQVHHRRFRSAGGSDEPWNLTTLCADHHLRLVHEGGSHRTGGRLSASAGMTGIVYTRGTGSVCAGETGSAHTRRTGSVLIEGRAPDRLVWKLGTREEGLPALIFEGERCVFRLVDKQGRGRAEASSARQEIGARQQLGARQERTDSIVA